MRYNGERCRQVYFGKSRTALEDSSINFCDTVVNGDLCDITTVFEGFLPDGYDGEQLSVVTKTAWNDKGTCWIVVLVFEAYKLQCAGIAVDNNILECLPSGAFGSYGITVKDFVRICMVA